VTAISKINTYLYKASFNPKENNNQEKQYTFGLGLSKEWFFASSYELSQSQNRLDMVILTGDMVFNHLDRRR
jgi:hypothetical protein